MKKKLLKSFVFRFYDTEVDIKILNFLENQIFGKEKTLKYLVLKEISENNEMISLDIKKVDFEIKVEKKEENDTKLISSGTKIVQNVENVSDSNQKLISDEELEEDVFLDHESEISTKPF